MDGSEDDEVMKVTDRYWLFACPEYDARGGIDDLEATSMSRPEIEHIVTQLGHWGRFWHIVDTETGSVTYSNGNHTTIGEMDD